jgi:adenylate cyclase
MLTSKDVIQRAHISRATLNNYIALGILPKPEVRKPGLSEDRAPRLGYFPTSVLETIHLVHSFKKEGYAMAKIVEMVKDPAFGGPKNENDPPKDRSAADPKPAMDARRGANPLRLTLEEIDQPAYMVNSRFELEWWNEEANTKLLGGNLQATDEIGERNLFKLLCNAPDLRGAESWEELVNLHLSIAKNRLPKKSFWTLDGEIENDDLEALITSYDKADPIVSRAMIRREINLAAPNEEPRWINLYVSFFREGVFFVFEEMDIEQDSLATFLSRRDLVIRELLRKRRPYLTPLSVLVADLQSSVKICAELPPDEYFDLINNIWEAMESKLRKYHATHGKHVGDGMVYYFLPQPDDNYLLNAMQCAFDMKQTMLEVSREWRGRKNWLNELHLNTGIHEGEEWFGTYQTPTHIECTVLGDTINQSARLSDLAREGSIWVTKSLVSKLSSKEREMLRYGIRRKSENGQEFVVESTYSRVSNLVDLDNPKYEKFRDIAMLPVTEVLDLKDFEPNDA